MSEGITETWSTCFHSSGGGVAGCKKSLNCQDARTFCLFKLALSAPKTDPRIQVHATLVLFGLVLMFPLILKWGDDGMEDDAAELKSPQWKKYFACETRVEAEMC